MAFLRQEYWSGLPFPTPGNLPNPGIEPASPAWQPDSLPLGHLEVGPRGLISLFLMWPVMWLWARELLDCHVSTYTVGEIVKLVLEF